MDNKKKIVVERDVFDNNKIECSIYTYDYFIGLITNVTKIIVENDNGLCTVSIENGEGRVLMKDTNVKFKVPYITAEITKKYNFKKVVYKFPE